MSRSSSPTRATCCWIPAAAWSRRCIISAVAPFFVLNSDSIWVEGPVAALPAMIGHWDPERMDGLLLLADMQTAMGYEGMGDFVLKAGGHVLRARDHAGAAYAYPGVQIAHPRMFDERARRPLLHQSDVGPRHRPAAGCSAPCWTAYGSMSARPTHAMRRKPISGRRLETSECLHHRPQRALRGDAGAGADRARR